MKYICFIILYFCGFCINGYSQKDETVSLYKKLKTIKSVPFEEVGDSLYWDIVIGGLNNIPELINLLDNSEETGIAVSYFGTDYSVADIAYNIIGDIIYNIPTMQLIEEAGGCIKDEGFSHYWYFLKGNNKNRQWFKETVRKWYETHKSNLVWYKTDMCKYNDSIEIPNFKNPAGGYYLLKKRD